jgi:hypothetical protein
LLPSWLQTRSKRSGSIRRDGESFSLNVKLRFQPRGTEMPPDADARLVCSRRLIAKSIDHLGEIYRAIERSQNTIARSQQVLARGRAQAPEPQVTQPLRKRPKRNKLAFKNRWLISANVVAALRRAGVDCSIVVPDEDGGLLALGDGGSEQSRH